MISIRGVPTDYDGWVERGCQGLGAGTTCCPISRKQETDVDFDGPLHGQDGPMGRPPHSLKTAGRASPRALSRPPETMAGTDLKDKNASVWRWLFPDRGRQSGGTAAPQRRRAYLTTEVRARPNFNILGESRVEKVLFSGTKATGVRVHRRGEVFDIQANEVIVSAGALQSPALLLRSGVGPAARNSRKAALMSWPTGPGSANI